MNSNLARLTLVSLWAAAITASAQREAVAQFMLGTPTNLGAPVNTRSDEYAPELSADGLSLYYQSGSWGTNAQIYMATRDTVYSPWKNPQPIGPPINTRYAEGSPSLSPDGKELYFSDGHREGYPEPLRPGGLGGPDIWVSFWNEENGSWIEPQNLGAPVNSPHHDYKANLSANGRELYFSSDRPGGDGAADIWVARRPTVNDPWGEPTNLGAVVNGGRDDENPAISPDGKMLVFGSNRRGGGVGPSGLWVSTRERNEDGWGEPFYLGNDVNGTYWNTEPDFSGDGATLFFNRWDPVAGGELWQVSLSPLEPVSLTPGSDAYQQTFDEALTSNSNAGSVLPTGWTTSNNGVIFQNVTTSDFPVTRSIRGSVFNAGGEEDTDRTLAIGVASRRNADIPMLQFLTELEATDAAALRLQFDLEAWDAESRADTPGEAAFNVLVEVDSGEGFALLHEFSNVTTGAQLSPPEGDYLDGNLDDHRVSFDSGVQMATIPAGSALRIRWEVPESAETSGWVFGLDDVELNLFGSLVDAFDCNADGSLDVLDANCSAVASLDGTLSAANLIKGDANGDGSVAFSDFLTLSANFGSSGFYTDGDFDKDGTIAFSDFLLLSSNFGQSSAVAAAVPEPSSVAMALLGVVGLLTITRRRR